jgi:3-oxoacyl-[acyl-carrier protein] reductase
MNSVPTVTRPAQLAGQLALVTGASRGIGKAVAQALLSEGAIVVGTATTAAGAEGISQWIAEAGGQGRGVVLDVSDGDAIDAVMAEIEKTSGAIAILVNNAGITRDNLAMRMKDEEWDAVINTNLRSVYKLSRAVLRGMMKARAGRIINITSVVGAAGNAGQINYAAAKAGIGGMTRSLAREIGSRGITVNCVAPGFIDTDMTRALSEEQRNGLLGQIPLARLGSVEDIAAAVLYLASPGGAYVSGTTLHVNGGMFMN